MCLFIVLGIPLDTTIEMQGATLLDRFARDTILTDKTLL